jgi:hypothetical protein
VTTDADVRTGGTTPVSFARLDLSAYDTDKISNDYLQRYDPFVAPLADTPVAVAELGVLRGGSLWLGRDYFRKGTIVGLDRARVAVDDPERRIQIHQGSQDDTGLLTHIAREHAPAGVDPPWGNGENGREGLYVAYPLSIKTPAARPARRSVRSARTPAPRP